MSGKTMEEIHVLSSLDFTGVSQHFDETDEAFKARVIAKYLPRAKRIALDSKHALGADVDPKDGS